MAPRRRKGKEDAQEPADAEETKVHDPRPSSIITRILSVILFPLRALAKLLDPKRGEEKETRVGVSEGLQILRVTWDIVKPKWHWFAAAWVGVVANATVGAVQPMLIGSCIDLAVRASSKAGEGSVAAASIALRNRFLLIFLLHGVAAVGRGAMAYLGNSIGDFVRKEAWNRCFCAAVQSEVGFFDKIHSSEIKTAHDKCSHLHWVAGHMVQDGVATAVTLLVSLFYIATSSASTRAGVGRWFVPCQSTRVCRAQGYGPDSHSWVCSAIICDRLRRGRRVR